MKKIFDFFFFFIYSIVKIVFLKHQIYLLFEKLKLNN